MIEKKIYYHDTDCGGVVYYANYLKYLEEARTEYLQSKGIDLGKLAQRGILFAVSDVEIKYKAPAYYQDKIKVIAQIESNKAASIVFFQKIYRENTLLIEARVKLVCVDKNIKPIPLPAEIKSALN
ncbi:MAG: YbgC/FadM family acyl-CoA thioesterase [Candidatus Omnitrophota bacterium]